MTYQEMTAQELLDVVMQEEAELRFTDFSNSQAYALGQCIVEHFETLGVASIEIFINGACKFSYFPDGTNPNNAIFLANKRHCVENKEMSSLGLFAWLQVNDRTQNDVCMPASEYCVRGGSFPIRLQGGSVIGSVTVSALPHFDDHRLVVTSLRKFLGK